jgi:hypothetical protein
LTAIGAEVVVVLVFGVADVGHIDTTDEADLAQTRGDGDKGAAIVALALAAELIFGDLGRLAATGTANAEGQMNSNLRDKSIFERGSADARESCGGRRRLRCEICNTPAGQGVEAAIEQH